MSETLVKQDISHSRGPWRFDESIGWIWADNPHGHGQMHVADIRGWGHLTGTGACGMSSEDATAIQLANGRLAAAAPELLKACEAWVRYFDELERISDPTDPLAEARRVYHGKRLDVTRAAIAKATPAPAVNETP